MPLTAHTTHNQMAANNRDRIRLLPAEPQHAELWHAWRKQPEARRFMPMAQVPVNKLRDRLDACHYNLSIPDQPEYRWMIEHGDTLVGTVALTNVSASHQHGEVSYHVDANYHCMGIGRAAVAELLDRVYRHTRINRLWATISLGNIASRRLIESLEFRRDGCFRQHFIIEGEYVDQLIYSLLRREWQGASGEKER